MSFLSKLFGGGKPQPTPVQEHKPKEIYDFRHVKDVNNIVFYETCSNPLQTDFAAWLNQYFPTWRVDQAIAPSSIFPGAPSYAMPINFIITTPEKKTAILLVDQSQMRRYSFLETRELCIENGLDFIYFYLHLPNEEEYVVARLKELLG